MQMSCCFNPHHALSSALSAQSLPRHRRRKRSSRYARPKAAVQSKGPRLHLKWGAADFSQQTAGQALAIFLSRKYWGLGRRCRDFATTCHPGKERQELVNMLDSYPRMTDGDRASGDLLCRASCWACQGVGGNRQGGHRLGGGPQRRALCAAEGH